MDGVPALSRGTSFGGDDSSAFASNWRTLLVVDAGIALAAVLIGLSFAIAGHPWALVAAVGGLVYGFFVGGRAARWRRLRRRAGL